MYPIQFTLKEFPEPELEILGEERIEILLLIIVMGQTVHSFKFIPTLDRLQGTLSSFSFSKIILSLLIQPIVTKALDGFNGTIFAYGQTGSVFFI